MIHTTIGIYPNGYAKFNGVSSEFLKDHIQYNKDFRPGRMLMVDGEIVLPGYGSNQQADKKYLDNLRSKKMTKDTQPYQ